MKEANFFFNPTGSMGHDIVSNYLSIGDRPWSLFDRIGTTEHMKRLFEAIGTDNTFQDVGINRQRYEADRAIWDFDTERLSGAPSGGYNMSHGRLLRLHFARVGDGVNYNASRCYVAMHYDCILELTARGAVVHQ